MRGNATQPNPARPLFFDKLAPGIGKVMFVYGFCEVVAVLDFGNGRYSLTSPTRNSVRIYVTMRNSESNPLEGEMLEIRNGWRTMIQGHIPKIYTEAPILSGKGARGIDM